MIQDEEATVDQHAAANASFAAKLEQEVKVGVKDVLAAVEKWYEGHFHRSVKAGRSPIAAEDKAQLIEHIQQAAQPKE